MGVIQRAYKTELALNHEQITACRKHAGAGAGLLLPPPDSHVRPIRSGKICHAPGWFKTAYLQSS